MSSPRPPNATRKFKYARFSEDRSLRFPVFRGIRGDVEPEECEPTGDPST